MLIEVASEIEAGDYSGEVTVIEQASGQSQTIQLQVEVKAEAEDEVEDDVYSDRFELRGLAWLNSDLGTTDGVTAPYVPVTVDEVSCVVVIVVVVVVELCCCGCCFDNMYCT